MIGASENLRKSSECGMMFLGLILRVAGENPLDPNLKGAVRNGTTMRHLRQRASVWSCRQSFETCREPALYAEHQQADNSLSGSKAENECVCKLFAHFE